jgi:hypothetical protein
MNALGLSSRKNTHTAISPSIHILQQLIPISYPATLFFVSCFTLQIIKPIYMRKQLLISLLSLFTTLTLFAQGNINKGNVMLGGRVSFTSTSVSGFRGSSTEFEATPNVGYFFADRFAGGMELGYSSNDDASTFIFSPYLRYYFLPATKKVNILAQGSFGFGSIKPDGFSSTSVNQYSFAAGPAIFLTPSVALEFVVGYASLGAGGGGNRLNTVALAAGFQVHLGGNRK